MRRRRITFFKRATIWLSISFIGFGNLLPNTRNIIIKFMARRAEGKKVIKVSLIFSTLICPMYHSLFPSFIAMLTTLRSTFVSIYPRVERMSTNLCSFPKVVIFSCSPWHFSTVRPLFLTNHRIIVAPTRTILGRSIAVTFEYSFTTQTNIFSHQVNCNNIASKLQYA